MKKVDRNHYKLENGRKIYACLTVIGIGPDLKAFNGYDGDLGEFEGPFTATEKAEIATYMIGLWSRWGWPGEGNR